MGNRIVLVCCFFILQLGAADSFASRSRKVGIQVDSQLVFKSGAKTIKSNSTVVIKDNGTGWFPLTKAQEGVVLLGQLSPMKKDVVRIKYMIIDTSADPVSVSTMSVTAKYGSPAEIKSESGADFIQVTGTFAKMEK